MAADTDLLKTWLRATELALECEEVPRSTIVRVINRLLYGHPDPNAASHDRR